MSKLTEMIESLCPDGVEYVKLGEVCEMKRGTPITKKEIEDGDIPVVAGGVKPAYYCNKSNRDGDIITVAGSGANAGFVAYWDKPIYASDSFTVAGNDKIITKYIYYFLTSIQNKVYATKTGGGVPHVHISYIENFTLPLPPLPIQQEIVRILDTFTQLQTELQTELQLRKKQYNYYREQLLTFGEDVERKRLGDVATIAVGGDVPKGRFSKEKTEQYNIPIFSNGTGDAALYGFTDKARISEPSITISARGTIGACALRETPYFPIVRLICVIPKDGLYVNYLKHYVDTINFRVPVGGIPQLTAPEVANTGIPLPPLEKQREIASILDKFSALTTSLTEGIPAEIELRRKQYNYYRELLLTFKHKAL